MRPVPLPCALYEAIDSKEAIVLIRIEKIMNIMNIISKTIAKSLYDHLSSASSAVSESAQTYALWPGKNICQHLM